MFFIVFVTNFVCDHLIDFCRWKSRAGNWWSFEILQPDYYFSIETCAFRSVYDENVCSSHFSTIDTLGANIY